MAGALTIVVCPEHGPRAFDESYVGRPCSHLTSGHVCGRYMDRVRVFREEDVRPLYDTVDTFGVAEERVVLDRFPAPEEWKA